MTSNTDDAMSLPAAVIRYAKEDFEKSHTADQSFDDYLKQLLDPRSSAALPIEVDTGHPLSEYYISSSHNTYLTGNQLWGRSSTDAYRDVLKRGCRCIEIDVWDGGSPDVSDQEDEETEDEQTRGLVNLVKTQIGRLRSHSQPQKIARVATEPPLDQNTHMPTPWRTWSDQNEPKVLHGHTATKEISFRKVCEIVRDYAFWSTHLPLIVSLEVHCSPQQQEVMVEIMSDYWKQYLVRRPSDFSDETQLPTLESLKQKILIKVKWSPPAKKGGGRKRADRQSIQSGEGQDISEDEGQNETVSKGKIIETLSKLGIYTRALHFKGLKEPEAEIPTHVFAISEVKLLALNQRQPDELFQHNLAYMMRVYPKATRILSSNLDPALFWRVGVQLVALNWQKLNAAVMLNEAQFEGTGGWVLKPDGYRPSAVGSRPEPRRTTVNLAVKILAGHNLGLQTDVPNAYVKCELHVESSDGSGSKQTSEAKSKGGQWKRRSHAVHARDPDFGARTLEFSGVHHVVTELSWLRIKVMDESSYQKDRLIGWYCFRLDRLRQGLQLLYLRAADATLSSGKLLLAVQMDARCPARLA